MLRLCSKEVRLTFNNSMYFEQYGVAVSFPIGFAIAGLLLCEVECEVQFLADLVTATEKNLKGTLLQI